MARPDLVQFWKEEALFQLESSESEEQARQVIVDVLARAVKAVTTQVTDGITDTLKEFLSDDYFTVYRAGFTCGTFKRFELDAAIACAHESAEEVNHSEDVWVDSIHGETVFELNAPVTDEILNTIDDDEYIIEVDDLT